MPVRLVAILCNVALLGAVAYLLFDKGVPSRTDEILILLLVIAAPVTGLAALLTGSTENLLGLYLERKALEERKKIEELRVRK